MLQQAIERPFGINVFGSSLIRVEPDIVSLDFKIENTAEHPKDAFAVVRSASARDLGRTEEILLGVLEAGATEISDTNFQTSRLKELRARARREAVAAAREKAQLYAQETGVELGRVLHIEDINPESLRVGVHSGAEVAMDAEVEAETFNPASIPVTAAVVIAFGFAEV